MESFGSKSPPNDAPWPPQGSILSTSGIIFGDFWCNLAHMLVTFARISVTVDNRTVWLIFVPLG